MNMRLRNDDNVMRFESMCFIMYMLIKHMDVSRSIPTYNRVYRLYDIHYLINYCSQHLWGLQKVEGTIVFEGEYIPILTIAPTPSK